jgi:hypothetical protein
LGFEPTPGRALVADLAAAPVAAPGNGEIAVGWLCVSTFISMWVWSSTVITPFAVGASG